MHVWEANRQSVRLAERPRDAKNHEFRAESQVADPAVSSLVRPPIGVSVIIPCRNEADHIGLCLESVFKQEAPAGGFEVIVADGLSDDGTREILRRWARQEPRLRVIANPGRIAATGLNAALAVARGSVIVRMDAHVEYAPDYLQQCIEILESSQAQNVGGPTQACGNGCVSSAIAAAFHSPFSVGGSRFHNLSYEGAVGTVPFGCWPRQVFDTVGRFDTELVKNQDDEFNLRIRLAGGTIWQSPRIRSIYHPRGSLLAVFQQYFQYGYWKVRVIRKHARVAHIRHLVPAAFVAAIVLLGITACVSESSATFFIGILSVYLACVLLASLVTAYQAGWQLLAVLPAVFWCYHFGYGLGFLAGIWDFFVRRRQPCK